MLSAYTYVSFITVVQLSLFWFYLREQLAAWHSVC